MSVTTTTITAVTMVLLLLLLGTRVGYVDVVDDRSLVLVCDCVCK